MFFHTLDVQTKGLKTRQGNAIQTMVTKHEEA